MIAENFCPFCVHIHQTRVENRVCCNAYPIIGIPNEIFWASKLHNEILPDQEGDYIFTNREGSENYVPKLASTGIEMEFASMKEFKEWLKGGKKNDEK